jgi:methylmalonyl-CoA mutase C-terminal domain/subunit
MVRVVVAHSAPLGADRRAALVARVLRDEGHEVVDAGEGGSPASIVETAIQEDADLIGLVDTAGEGAALLDAVVGRLVERGADDIPVLSLGDLEARQLADRVAEELGDSGDG